LRPAPHFNPRRRIHRSPPLRDGLRLLRHCEPGRHRSIYACRVKQSASAKLRRHLIHVREARHDRNQKRRQLRHMARSLRVRMVLAPTVWEGSERSRSLQAHIERTLQRDHSGHNGCELDVGGSRAWSGKQAFGGRVVVAISPACTACPLVLQASPSGVTLQ
jgi:hypothetical protein